MKMANIPFKSRPVTVGIDFSNDWIKIAQAEPRSGQMHLVTVAAAQFGAEPDEKKLRKEFSRLLWSILKVKPGTVVSCIPRQSVTIRFLKLPSTNEAEIEKMLEFQATKQLPFLKEDIVTGYKILEVNKDGYSRIMLAIAQRAVLNEHLAILRSAGILPSAVYLSSEAILNWFLHASASADSGIFLLLNIDYLFTELLISKAENILFSRAFAIGANSLHKLESQTDIAAWVQGLRDQIRISLTAFEREKTNEYKSVDRIFVFGGISKFFEYIHKDLYKEFAVPIEYRSIEFAEAIDKPVSFLSAIGMAIDKEALKLDLTPPELKIKRLYRQKQKELFRFYVLSVSILICLFALIGIRFYYKEAYLKYLNTQLIHMKPSVEKTELMIERLNIIKNQSDIRKVPLEILTEVYSIVPQDMNLYGLSFSENKLLLMRGTSKTMSRIFDVVSMLENSKHFKNVKVVFANKRKIQTEEVVDFQISCVLK